MQNLRLKILKFTEWIPHYRLLLQLLKEHLLVPKVSKYRDIEQAHIAKIMVSLLICGKNRDECMRKHIPSKDISFSCNKIICEINGMNVNNENLSKNKNVC